MSSHGDCDGEHDSRRSLAPREATGTRAVDQRITGSRDLVEPSRSPDQPVSLLDHNVKTSFCAAAPDATVAAVTSSSSNFFT